MFEAPRLTGFAESLQIDPAKSFRSVGHIAKLVGLTLESVGPACSVGDLVAVGSNKPGRPEQLAEVVGFRDSRVLLFPLDSIGGVRAGDGVRLVNEGFRVPVGAGMLGRVVDGLGRPIDGLGPLDFEAKWPVRRAAPNSMSRARITEHFTTGVKSIDSCLACGSGQRIGIFAGSGVGKSTLLGMICRNSISDINVVALIGERGKEVRDFIEDSLGPEGMKKTIVVVSTSDKSPLQRVKGAEVAMAMAEYFREQGKRVLFVMDSVTRYSMAQREIGLSIGEPPATRGYPPSVFSMMPALLERAGNSDKGSITGFFTVLVEGDDMNDPIGDTARGILDGHIVLTRELAAQGHYPSIDVLQSVSRVMSSVTNKEQQALARELRKLLAAYKRAEDMINIGAYKQGSNPEIDKAIAKRNAIEAFLTQEVSENAKFPETFAKLKAIFAK